MALMVANSLYIGAGIAQLEILPAFAKNEAGVSRAAGSAGSSSSTRS